MSFLAPLLPVAGMALGGLFGGAGKSAPQVNFTPPGFSAGGLNATFGGNGYNVTPSGDRMAAVGGISDTFGQQAGDIAGLRSQFAPGFSNLRTAQLNNISSNRTAAIGNLQQNLQSRRVLGSSFAQDAVNRTQAQYDQQQQETIAQTYLQELQANQQLIQQQYAAARGGFETALNEMNLEASIAANLTAGASKSLESAAATQAELDAKAAAGAGSFFGNLGGSLGTALSKMNFGGVGAFA
jgi:hypothetical protein